jgi:hypothetical protein
MNIFSPTAAPRRVSATKSRLVGARRATQPASPVNCRLNFTVTVVGIDPMEASA